EEKKSVQAPPGPLDKLDPKNIPAAERFPWQPKELVAVLGEHRRRHLFGVQEVAYSGDGRWIASIAPDGVYLLEASTLRECLRPGMDEGGIAVAFAPDGKMMAATMKRGIVFWDVSGPEPREQLTIPIQASRLAFKKDGKTLAATVLDNQTLSMWDLSGAKPM